MLQMQQDRQHLQKILHDSLGLGAAIGGYFPLAFQSNFPESTMTASKSCSVAADKLCCRMYDNICTMLDRTDQIRSTKGIVYDNRNAVFVCNLCDRVNIRNVTVWISECL